MSEGGVSMVFLIGHLDFYLNDQNIVVDGGLTAH